ncbi:MAG: DUF1501 domain-containing protein [Caulobacteraceae bacterium]
MTMQAKISRRSALLFGAGLSVTFLGARGAVAAPAAFDDRKLVVIICRGAMDGLSVSPPVGDPNYAALRGAIAIAPDTPLKLDATFALHPKLTNLYALTQADQARIAPTVAIPQRIRSHFEAQDLLENGSGQLYGAATGWLNRTLQAVAPSRPIKALSIGAQEPMILHGPMQAESWSPGGRLNPTTDRVAAALQELYKLDPLLGPALATGLTVESQAISFNGGKPSGGDAKAFAVTAAQFLTAPDGPSIAVLSLDGFDTHANQGAETGQLANRLAILDGVIAGLQTGMGAQWSKTVVVVATEFGRTAHVNGTGGTDHGTASTLILAGGALKPGGIIGDWPTLDSAKLFEARDLAPTLDVRQVFKGVLIEHLGVDGRALETAIFPDSRDARPVRGLIA